jgi:hypothetical protein
MAESKVRDENFFMVSGWMLNRLNLKGTALHVFAIIYGFSQDGEGSFTGSLQYLCDFTNTTKKPVIKALKELSDKGYVIKTENTINGVKFNTYKTSPLVVEKLHRGSGETPPGVVEKLHRGSGEITPNNKDNNKSIDNKKIDNIISLYHSICVSLPKIRGISDARKKAIQNRLQKYSLEDFETVFRNAESSSFLKGADGGWKASFDWLIKEGNMLKVLEGNYAAKPKRGRDPVPGWMEHSLGDAEMGAIQRLLKEPAPELAERAEKLKQRLGG